MTIATATIPSRTFADLHAELGRVPLDRILVNPPIGNATEADVVRLLESADKRLCELVNGVLVEKAKGARESIIASLIVYHFWDYLKTNDLGIPMTADGPVRIKRGRIRVPDACFVSWERLPNESLPDEAILDAVPDIAIEVISKSNTAKEMSLKLKDYFEKGVRLVWYIYPKTETAVVYTSPKKSTTLLKNQALDGADVLPGFSLPLSELFAERTRRKPKS